MPRCHYDAAARLLPLRDEMPLRHAYAEILPLMMLMAPRYADKDATSAPLLLPAVYLLIIAVAALR